MEIEPNQPLLRAIEVARRLNISRALAYQLMQRGDIRTVSIGSARRVRREDLERYIQDNLSQAGYPVSMMNSNRSAL